MISHFLLLQQARQQQVRELESKKKVEGKGKDVDEEEKPRTKHILDRFR